jgi:hypothetical protein
MAVSEMARTTSMSDNENNLPAPSSTNSRRSWKSQWELEMGFKGEKMGAVFQDTALGFRKG